MRQELLVSDEDFVRALGRVKVMASDHRIMAVSNESLDPRPWFECLAVF
jgi:hypothetical protein